MIPFDNIYTYYYSHFKQVLTLAKKCVAFKVACTLPES